MNLNKTGVLLTTNMDTNKRNKIYFQVDSKITFNINHQMSSNVIDHILI